MAGINADAHAGFIFYAIDNGGQMLKLKAKIAALPGGVFNNCGHALGLREGNVDGLGNPRQAFVFRDLH
ncbi:hypothetical protein D3C81_2136050 [compost metagenome]